MTTNEIHTGNGTSILLVPEHQDCDLCLSFLPDAMISAEGADRGYGGGKTFETYHGVEVWKQYVRTGHGEQI